VTAEGLGARVCWCRGGGHVCTWRFVCAPPCGFLLSWKTLPLDPAAFVRRSRFHFSPNSVSAPWQGLGSGRSLCKPRPPLSGRPWKLASRTVGCRLQGPHARLSRHLPFSTLSLGTRGRTVLGILGPSASPVCGLPAACPPLCPLVGRFCFGDAHPPPRSLSPLQSSFSPATPKPGPPRPCEGGQRPRV